MTENNEPVAGCAVILRSTDIAYSNFSGKFEIRQKKKSVSVIVDTEQFTVSGTWAVLSAPSTVTAGEMVNVIVRRVQ